MRVIYKRFSVIAGFAVLLAVLVINTGHHAPADCRPGQQSGRVEHTQRCAAGAGAIESLLKDAETGQRGFLYTGEARYLEPYDTAVKQVDAHIDRLAELLRTIRGSGHAFPGCAALKKQKLAELAETVALRTRASASRPAHWCSLTWASGSWTISAG